MYVEQLPNCNVEHVALFVHNDFFITLLCVTTVCIVHCSFNRSMLARFALTRHIIFVGTYGFLVRVLFNHVRCFLGKFIKTRLFISTNHSTYKHTNVYDSRAWHIINETTTIVYIVSSFSNDNTDDISNFTDTYF